MNYLLIAIIVVVVVCILYFLLTYNKLIKLRNKVNESFATMDVYLKKRWDLIPNIVETVKAYANYEKETLEKVIELRNNNYDNMSDNEKIEKNKELTKSINKIIALAESYPNLKANENFLSLNDQLSKIEDEIAESRKYYNAVVRNYNNKVEMIPSNIVASIMKFKTKEMYEIDSNKKNNVKVEI